MNSLIHHVFVVCYPSSLCERHPKCTTTSRVVSIDFSFVWWYWAPDLISMLRGYHLGFILIPT